MTATISYAQTDAMIARLESDLFERNSFIQGLIEGAQSEGRDLTKNETELIGSAEERVASCKNQLEILSRSRSSVLEASEQMSRVNQGLQDARRQANMGEIKYRSAGQWAADCYLASMGGRESQERLAVYNRAAAHQKTGDTTGLIPDPIVGEVLNFIDTARPLVSMLGARQLPSASWHRPKVTQQPSVAKQGSAGGAADEKLELVSQKMIITRIDGTAVTYGGYVNVSRQDIDFSNSAGLDAVINGLAGQYAIQTEAALGAALIAATGEVELAPVATSGVPSVDELVTGLWAGVASVYNATKGLGSYVLAVSPSKLGAWGKAFAPYNPVSQQGTGFAAGNFAQGIMGTISGIPVVMSGGITGAATDYGVLFSTAAVEVYEERVGALSVTEPSVLGVQVGYAGYFTVMTVESGGVVRIVNEV